jgi:hypothetical protein
VSLLLGRNPSKRLVFTTKDDALCMFSADREARPEAAAGAALSRLATALATTPPMRSRDTVNSAPKLNDEEKEIACQLFLSLVPRRRKILESTHSSDFA